MSDSAQYYTGRAFGRRPLAPSISPKKTIEGAIGGVVFGIVFMMLAASILLPQVPLLVRGLLGAAVVALGIVGDLFESRLKRLAGTKDSSSLIPGHGGVLDRIDALLFATPAFYYVVCRRSREEPRHSRIHRIDRAQRAARRRRQPDASASRCARGRRQRDAARPNRRGDTSRRSSRWRPRTRSIVCVRRGRRVPPRSRVARTV
jgi:hypothetical protein